MALGEGVAAAAWGMARACRHTGDYLSSSIRTVHVDYVVKLAIRGSLTSHLELNIS